MTILQKYYADQKRYAFSFQMMAYISRIALMRAALKKNYKVIIIERSVYTDSAVFAKMLFDDKKIEEIEYKIYLRWVNEFINEFPPVKFIYVRAEPAVSFDRILQRGRLGEMIPIEYLQNCHKYHDDWLLLTGSPLLILNADADIKKDSETLVKWIQDINNFIYKKWKIQKYKIFKKSLFRFIWRKWILDIYKMSIFKNLRPPWEKGSWKTRCDHNALISVFLWKNVWC